ncbi:MAG: NADH-quinone oxidoreductase subunit K [Infirmifilum sp.]
MIDVLVVLGGALVLVLAGIAVVVATRNLLKVVMGIQSIILGGLLILSVVAQGEAGIILVPAIAAAASEAVGMAVLAFIWEKHRKINPHEISELRW